MPYGKTDVHQAYNKGYRAGARRIVLAYFGNKCCVCGEENIRKLEISHIRPVRKSWRDYTDWLNKDNIRILCKSCNQAEENSGRGVGREIWLEG